MTLLSFYLAELVGAGDADAFPAAPPVCVSGSGEALTSMLGIGRAGVERSGAGDVVTLPEPSMFPQAQSSRLSARTIARYAKDRFISIRLFFLGVLIVCI